MTLAQNSGTLLPSGVTAPRPVTTTRRLRPSRPLSFIPTARPSSLRACEPFSAAGIGSAGCNMQTACERALTRGRSHAPDLLASAPSQRDAFLLSRRCASLPPPELLLQDCR